MLSSSDTATEKRHFDKMNILTTIEGMSQIHRLINGWPFPAILPVQTVDELELLAIELLRQVTEYRKKYLTRSGMVRDKQVKA